jgi:hypothetical protein
MDEVVAGGSLGAPNRRDAMQAIMNTTEFALGDVDCDLELVPYDKLREDAGDLLKQQIFVKLHNGNPYNALQYQYTLLALTYHLSHSNALRVARVASEAWRREACTRRNTSHG